MSDHTQDSGHPGEQTEESMTEDASYSDDASTTDEATSKDEESSNSNSSSTDKAANYKSARQLENLWPQIKQLLVFQLKLYVDALRDLLMSPFSVVIFVIDLIQGNKGDDALFASLMSFGRKSERAINLFNQHDIDDKEFRSIDSIIAQVEESVRREHRDGSVSNTAKDSLEKSLDLLKKKIKGAMK